MPNCQAPISDATLLDYWARDLADGDEADRVEEHLFACGDCSARLHRLAALGPALATLVRQPDAEVVWATPAAVVRQMPSMRLQLTLASAGATRAELGRYVLDHSASTRPA